MKQTANGRSAIRMINVAQDFRTRGRRLLITLASIARELIKMPKM